MTHTTFVICAAGAGTRFSSLIPDVPKPLIKLSGATLLEWSLKSLPILPADDVIIITQAKDGIKAKLAALLATAWPFNHFQWLELTKPTRGQLETVFLARKLFDRKKSLTIYNSDSYFLSPTLSQQIRFGTADGLIPCSKQPGTAWSFCQVIKRSTQVVAVAEKKRISPWASVGLYFFRNTTRFLKYARQELVQTGVKEYFVAPLYQRYLKADANIQIDKLPLFKPMGTPEQVKKYWGVKPAELVRQNNLGKTIIVDLDGTITIDDPNQLDYALKKPNKPLIKKLKTYHDQGYQVIIHTARRMQTHQNQQAKVIKDIAEITINWLKKHQVPYDGLQFGKPYASAFSIDDKAIRPGEFVKLSEKEIKELMR